jgi:4-amino-4-deoxy-L-arabinose transferase-like glycosyltransferase
LLAQRRSRQVLHLLHPLGIAAFALIAVPWFATMQARYPGYFEYFFIEQHFRRYAEMGFNNVQPFWFFVPVLLLLTLPWSLWLVPALRMLRLRGPSSGDVESSIQRLPWSLYAWWIVAVVGFFSLPSSKLVGYVLPALAPLCALLGLAALRGRAWRWVMPLAALGCVALVVGMAWKPPASNRDLGQALGARLQPGDRVVFVDNPFYDVPFYASMKQQPIVLSRWADPEIPLRDNWRKELYDSARFDAASGALRLWPTERAAELLCAPGTVWFVAQKGWKPPPGLSELALVVEGRRGNLWHATGGPRTGCP